MWREAGRGARGRAILMVLSKAAMGQGPTLSLMREEPKPDARVPVSK